MVDGPVGLAPPSAGAGRHLLYGAGQSGRAVRLCWRHRPAGAWLAQLSERSGQGFWAARSCGLMGHGAVARRPPSAMSRDLMGHRPWRAVRAPWAMSVRVAVVSRRRSRGAPWRYALRSDARAGPAGQLVEHGRAGLCGLSRWGAARLSRTLPTGESGHPPDACRGRRELYYNALPLGSVPAVGGAPRTLLQHVTSGIDLSWARHANGNFAENKTSPVSWGRLSPFYGDGASPFHGDAPGDIRRGLSRAGDRSRR